MERRPSTPRSRPVVITGRRDGNRLGRRGSRFGSAVSAPFRWRSWAAGLSGSVESGGGLVICEPSALGFPQRLEASVPARGVLLHYWEGESQGFFRLGGGGGGVGLVGMAGTGRGGWWDTGFRGRHRMSYSPAISGFCLDGAFLLVRSAAAASRVLPARNTSRCYRMVAFCGLADIEGPIERDRLMRRLRSSIR